jgi:hypothetical protein
MAEIKLNVSGSLHPNQVSGRYSSLLCKRKMKLVTIEILEKKKKIQLKTRIVEHIALPGRATNNSLLSLGDNVQLLLIH